MIGYDRGKYWEIVIQRWGGGRSWKSSRLSDECL